MQGGEERRVELIQIYFPMKNQELKERRVVALKRAALSCQHVTKGIVPLFEFSNQRSSTKFQSIERSTT
jgi:hypothetical protein